MPASLLPPGDGARSTSSLLYPTKHDSGVPINRVAGIYSTRVAVGLSEQRLGDLAGQIESLGAHYVAVFNDDDSSRFLGLVSLVQVAHVAATDTRILCDLVGPTDASPISEESYPQAVIDAFREQGLREAVVVSPGGLYRGVVTTESLLNWSRAEAAQSAARLELETAELRKTKRELDAAVQARDQFMAVLSHELRTPLNPVLMIATDAAASPNLSDDVRGDFQTIVENVQAEVRLIDDLLDLTRISTGKILLKRELVEIDAVVRRAIAKVQPQAERHGLAVEFLGGVSAVVEADPIRLEQVIWNVVQNAAKFTAPGGRIEVRTSFDPVLPRVCIEIADTGIGMSSEELARLFDPFVKGTWASPAVGGQNQGLGLGLAIAKRLVELHGGAIAAASAGIGCGSQFFVWLPVANGLAAPVESRMAKEDLAGVSGPRQSVLVVEDHTATGAALAQLLSRRNCDVRSARTIAEARDLANGHAFTLVIADIGLPDGDGCELMRELRGRYGVPGIAVSGYGHTADLARSAAAGFGVHLLKPIRADDLERAMATVLRSRPVAPG